MPQRRAVAPASPFAPLWALRVLVLAGIAAAWNPTITAQTALPAPVSGAGAVLGVTDQLLVIGGRTTAAPLAFSFAVFQYDPVARTWSTAYTLPVAFAFGACGRVVPPVGPSVVCFGGVNETGGLPGRMFMLSPKFAISVATTGLALAFQGAVQGPATTFLTGGLFQPFNLSLASRGCNELTASFQLRDCQLLPAQTAGVMCSTLGQGAICCGGESGGVSAACFTSTTLPPTWRAMAPLPAPRAYGCCVALPAYSRVCCFGGVDASGQLHTATHCLDTTTGVWATVAGVAYTPRRSLSCALLGNNVHLLGGHDLANVSLSVHEVFSDGLPLPPGACAFPALDVNGTCVAPTYELSTAAPVCGQPFTLQLAPHLAPTALQRFVVQLFTDPNCTAEVPGLQEQPIGGPQPTVTFAPPSAVPTAHACFHDETYPGAQRWVPMLWNRSQNGTLSASFPVRAVVQAYRSMPTRPLQGEDFQVTLVGAVGLNVVAPISAPRLRLSATADCADDAPGTPSNGYRLQAGAGAATPVALGQAATPLDPVFVCVADGAGPWFAVPPEADALAVLKRDAALAGVATGTGVAASVLAGLTAAGNPAGAAASLADVQVMALLGSFDCAPVSIKSYSSGNSWVLSPFGNLQVSSDKNFNNLVGSLGFILIVSSLHSLVVLLLLERQAPDERDEGDAEAQRPLTNRKQAMYEQFTAVHNRAKARLKFPKLELTFSLFLYQGFTLSAVKVMFGRTIGMSQSLALLIVAGLIGFVVIPIGFLAYLSWFVVRSLRGTLGTEGSPVEYVPISQDKFGNAVRTFPPPLNHLLASHYWRNVQTEYTALYGGMFQDYNRANYWFTLVVIARALIVALVLGTGQSGCRARVAVVFGLLLLYALVLLWRRPFRDRVANVLRVSVALLHAMAALSTVTSAVQPVMPALMTLASVLMMGDSLWLPIKLAGNWWAMKQLAQSEERHHLLEPPESDRESAGAATADGRSVGASSQQRSPSASASEADGLTGGGRFLGGASDAGASSRGSSPAGSPEPTTPVTGATGISVRFDHSSPSSGGGAASTEPENVSFSLIHNGSLERSNV